MAQQSWTYEELRSELDEFQKELRRAGRRDIFVHSSIDRAERFLRWLVGEYQPHGPIQGA